MTLGRVVVPKDVHGADYFETGGVGGDDDDGLLEVAGGVGRVGFPDNEVECAADVGRSGDPPFYKI